jgi:hypothetical protein
MPKTRRVQIDPELLKEIEELERRIRDVKVKNAEAVRRGEQLLERLRKRGRAIAG